MALFTCPDGVGDPTAKAVNEVCTDGVGTNLLGILSDADLELLIQNSIAAAGANFDVTMIDPAIATDLFIAGFLLCIVPWAAAYGAAKMLEILR